MPDDDRTVHQVLDDTFRDVNRPRARPTVHYVPADARASQLVPRAHARPPAVRTRRDMAVREYVGELVGQPRRQRRPLLVGLGVGLGLGAIAGVGVLVWYVLRLLAEINWSVVIGVAVVVLLLATVGGGRKCVTVIQHWHE